MSQLDVLKTDLQQADKILSYRLSKDNLSNRPQQDIVADMMVLQKRHHSALVSIQLILEKLPIDE